MGTRQETLGHDGANMLLRGGILCGDDNEDLQGFVGAPGVQNGVVFGFSKNGLYEPDDGGVLMRTSGMVLSGSAILINSMAGTEQRDVQIEGSGLLIPVDLPAPGWSVSDTDNGSYDLGTGTGVGTWVEMTGLIVTLTDAIGPAERIDFTARTAATNNTPDKPGTIEIGIGVDGADPTTPGIIHNISSEFNGVLSTAGNFTGLTLSIGQQISVFGRRTFSDDSNFNIILDGSVNNHFFEVYKSGIIGFSQLLNELSAESVNTEAEAIQAIRKAIYALTGYGIIRVVEGTTAEPTTDATPRKITAAWNDFGPSNVLTIDSGDSAIETPKVGTFEVDCRLTYTGDKKSIYKAEIYQWDDSASLWIATGIGDTSTFIKSGDIDVLSPTGILDLDIDDKVAVYHFSTDGGTTFTVIDGHLKLNQVKDDQV